MKTMYTILVVTEELRTCHALQSHLKKYDVVLNVDQKHVFGLRLKKPLKKNVPGLFLNYDTSRLSIEHATILQTNKDSAFITLIVCVIPKEVGQTTLYFSERSNGNQMLPIYTMNAIGYTKSQVPVQNY